MSSLYQRGTTWWAKAYLNGQVVRFSLSNPAIPVISSSPEKESRPA